RSETLHIERPGVEKAERQIDFKTSAANGRRVRNGGKERSLIVLNGRAHYQGWSDFCDHTKVNHPHVASPCVFHFLLPPRQDLATRVPWTGPHHYHPPRHRDGSTTGRIDAVWQPVAPLQTF